MTVTPVSPVGAMSVNETCEAADGPLFTTVTVQDAC